MPTRKPESSSNRICLRFFFLAAGALAATFSACGEEKPCRVSQGADGSVTLHCPDGSEAKIPADASCRVTDGGDGLVTLACPDGSATSWSTVVPTDHGVAPEHAWLCDGPSYPFYQDMDGPYERRIGSGGMMVWLFDGAYFASCLESLLLMTPSTASDFDSSLDGITGVNWVALPANTVSCSGSYVVATFDVASATAVYKVPGLDSGIEERTGCRGVY